MLVLLKWGLRYPPLFHLLTGYPVVNHPVARVANRLAWTLTMTSIHWIPRLYTVMRR